MRKSNLALLGAAALALLLAGSARAGHSAERRGPSAVLPGAAGLKQPGDPATLSQSECLSQATELACFSDGVSCARALDCCSGGCVNGQCGPRSKSRRRLARR